MNDGDDTLTPLPAPSNDDESDPEPVTDREHWEDEDSSIDDLVVDFLEVVESADSVDDPDLSSILELLRGSIDPDSLSAEELRRLLDDSD